ncbi:hypothetical protein D3C84_927740 [compost metagenome]
MCVLVEVKKLDGTVGTVSNAAELALLLGCATHHLIGPLKMDHCFDGYECLCYLDIEETANRFRYRVEYMHGEMVGAVMIERELWQ